MTHANYPPLSHLSPPYSRVMEFLASLVFQMHFALHLGNGQSICHMSKIASIWLQIKLYIFVYKNKHWPLIFSSLVSYFNNFIGMIIFCSPVRVLRIVRYFHLNSIFWLLFIYKTVFISVRISHCILILFTLNFSL